MVRKFVRSRVPAPVGSNQRQRKRDLLLLTKHAAFRSQMKSGWIGIRIMYTSGETCLPSDCCSSENPYKRVGLLQSERNL